jgi:hypothetical protein
VIKAKARDRARIEAFCHDMAGVPTVICRIDNRHECVVCEYAIRKGDPYRKGKPGAAHEQCVYDCASVVWVRTVTVNCGNAALPCDHCGKRVKGGQEHACDVRWRKR